jgi:hypothetical protein
LFAFFNNAEEVDLPLPRPEGIAQYRVEQSVWLREHARLRAAIADSPSPDKTLEDALKKHEGNKPKQPAAPAFREHKQPVQSFVHIRGDYRRRGDPVNPGTPAVLPAVVARSTAPDRLDLARWLVDRTNPLTARVTVNYWWKHLFGQGLVATPDDFGARGAAPSHPELLDWLASELPRQGWSRKNLIRLIVLSSTYRQSSDIRTELLVRDPRNQLLARQNRLRLEVEAVWDAAMHASGLLHRQIGGPSFRPPQAEYVTAISRNREWPVSPIPERHRRGMYILLRRATPYPTLLTFDAPDSTVTCARRERSNTPLQALTLLNDQVFVECAQALSRRILVEQGSRKDQVRQAFRICLGREPTAAEIALLRRLVIEQTAEFRDNPASVKDVIGNCRLAGADPVEQAALVMLGRVLLNLDEFITRE